MQQLIIDVDGLAIDLPESKRNYKAWEEDLTVNAVMIAGNMIVERRGLAWRISYQYGFFDDAMKERVIEACLKGTKYPILCYFLPPNSNEMIISEFFVTSFKSPTFFWSRNDNGTPVPLWADFSMELREVEPHD